MPAGLLAIVLVAIFVGCALDPTLAKSVEGTLSGMGGAVFSGPVNVAVNAWMKVAVIGAGLVLGVWVLETKIAKKEGAAGPAAAPDAATVITAHEPTFNPSGGFSAGSSGVNATGGINRTRVVTLPVRYVRSPGIGRKRAA